MNRSITDAHVHYFALDRLTYPWLNEVPALNQSFSTEHYQRSIEGIPVEKIVFVQCECLPEQYLDEVHYISELAQIDPRIQGIVAYFPLEQEHAVDQLEELLKYKLIKGVRRLEEDPSLYSDAVFVSNLTSIFDHGLTFDICVKSPQLPSVVSLIERQPQGHFMLDHLGKPDIKSGEFKLWSAAIKQIASNPNVYCKLSGMLTEADPANWKVAHLKPYYEYALEHFGVDRLLFGGDWPVVNLVDSYARWTEVFTELTKDLPETSLRKVWAENANRFYKLG